MSQITVWHGTSSTAQWAASASINDSVRSYKTGKFRVYYHGGKAGECAGGSYSAGRALNVGRPDQVAPDPNAQLRAAATSTAEVDGWSLAASRSKQSDVQGGTTLLVTHGTTTFSATFSAQQVTSGQAQMLVNENGTSRLVSYTPGRSSAFSVVEADSLPSPKIRV